MRIVGLDLSLTRTGVAVLDSERRTAECHSVTSKPSAPDYRSRLRRFDRIAGSIAGIVDGPKMEFGLPDLVIIEGPALSRNNSGTFERYGLWWIIAEDWINAGVPIAVVSPTTRAKWATGKGNAGKDEVLLAVDRLWPGVASNNDEADALAIATMGAQRFGWPVPTLSRHAASLGAVEWPTMAGEPVQPEALNGPEAAQKGGPRVMTPDAAEIARTAILAPGMRVGG